MYDPENALYVFIGKSGAAKNFVDFCLLSEPHPVPLLIRRKIHGGRRPGEVI